MLRRNLLQSLIAVPFISKFQSNEPKPFRTVKTESYEDGYWTKCTFDMHGNQLTYESLSGFWSKFTYDQNGNQLTYENSKGWFSESTGNQLMFEDSVCYKDKIMLRRNLMQKIKSCSEEIKPFRTEINEFSDGSWNKCTYEIHGNILTVEDSELRYLNFLKGRRYTYDKNGELTNELNYDWIKRTYYKKLI